MKETLKGVLFDGKGLRAHWIWLASLLLFSLWLALAIFVVGSAAYLSGAHRPSDSFGHFTLVRQLVAWSVSVTAGPLVAFVPTAIVRSW